MPTYGSVDLNRKRKEMDARGMFGNRLRRRRMMLGWSQVMLAEKLGIPAPAVSRYESGTYQHISLVRLTLLAEVLDTSVDYLLGLREDPGPIPPLGCQGTGEDVINSCAPQQLAL
jgi:transcriptional regulator with XRE-family HTH domain